MATVVNGPKRGVVDPLKHSQPLGAVVVTLGLHGAMPLVHGSRGCAMFAKALLTRHFREPVPVQTTGVTEVTAVIGAGESMVTSLDAIREKFQPEIIAVISTGLTEVSGEDIEAELNTYVEAAHRAAAEGGDQDVPLIIRVSTPDFRGGMSDGYAAMLTATVQAGLADGAATGRPALGQGTAAMLAGQSLTAVDADEINDMLRGFAFDPIQVPGRSGAMDGHTHAFAPVAVGGTTREDLHRLAGCGLIAGIGSTTQAAGAALTAATGAQLIQVPHLCGLGATDALVAQLLERTGLPAPEPLQRWRARLTDGLLDAHFVLAGSRIALALEPEQLLGVATLLAEVGVEVVTAVSPTADPVLAEVPCQEVVIGDLDDLETRAAEAGAELVLSSSHARALSHRIGSGLLPIGLPAYDRLGGTLRGTCGYRGSLQLLTDIANELIVHRETSTREASC